MEKTYPPIKTVHLRSAVLIVIALIGFSSCNKWLDVQPKTEIREDKLFSSEQGFKDALTGIYTAMNAESLYGKNLTFGMMSVLAQEYDISKDHTFHQYAQYNYEAQNVKATQAEIWNKMYNVIANINNLLEHLNKKKGILNPTDYKIIKGEALGLRGFLHFDLLRMFAPSYKNNPEAQAIPYITEFSKDVTPLSTVGKVIDSVVTDLNRAKQMLSIYKKIDTYTPSDYIPPEDLLLGYRQNHFNYWAACAELARVYLYRGDRQEALKEALEVIHSGAFGFVSKTSVSASNGYKDRTFIPGQIFALSDYDLPNIIPTYFKGEQNYANRLTLTAQERDHLFEVAKGGSTDFRYIYLWQNDGPTLYPSKFWQDDDVLDNYKNLMPLIRVPEMYYIAAEATPVIDSATHYLNTVRSHRGIHNLPDTLNQSQMQNEISKAYQKEFYAEGQLFYYYKRLDIHHIDRSEISADNKVYVFPLPDDEILYGDR